VERNENIHLFIIEDSYERGGAQHYFNTNDSAIADIFGSEPNMADFAELHDCVNLSW
jgi:hypothetical protein